MKEVATGECGQRVPRLKKDPQKNSQKDHTLFTNSHKTEFLPGLRGCADMASVIAIACTLIMQKKILQINEDN